MKFTRLRLTGFKTFVEPTEFSIERGLTGVVGPNGCGKSNLVEALRWVMGENSYKNMRASGMDDVIFSGSGRRPGRNSAEVTLFLDNEERLGPALVNQHDHLEVTRRIEREAGSAYRINGKEVRARDVQILFADASTGARSPAMVRQGQIGELISAKPVQRRAILEEAAGISGLHSRRNEAEMRLRAAEQNLERLEDVLVQIVAQVETLRRQARQAARYRALSADIRAAEATGAYLRWVAARAAVADAESELTAAERSATDRASAQATAATRQAIAATALPKLRDEAAAAAAGLQRLHVAAADLDAEERRITERLADLERRLAQFAEDRRREERIAAEMIEATAALDREAADIEADEAASADRVEHLAGLVADAEAELEASERDQAALLAEAARDAARRATLDRTLADATERVRRLHAELAGVVRERDAVAADADAEEALDLAREMHAEATAVAEGAEEAVVAAEERHAEARAALEARRAPLAAAEAEANRLDTEARTLASVLNAGRADGFAPVVDRLRVDPGFEAALGAALGDDLDASDDPAAPAHWGGSGDASADPALPEGATPLAGHVRGAPVLARRLAQVGLVTPADGARLAGALRPGQRLVTRAGDLWRWDGFVAAAEAPTAAAQRLAARNRLAALDALAAEAHATVARRRMELDAAKTAVTAAEARERALRDAARTARGAVSTTREALLRAEREAGQRASRRAALAETAARLAGDLDEARAIEADTAAALFDLAPADAHEEALRDLRSRIAGDRARLAEARAEAQGLGRESDLRRRRLDAIARERTGWESRAGQSGTQIDVLDRRIAEAEAEREELVDRPYAIEDMRRRLTGSIHEAETKRAEAADRLAEGDRDLAEADRAARAALDALSVSREARGRAEERATAARARSAEIAASVREQFNCTPDGLIDLAGLKPAAPLPELAGIDARAERLRQERERLGGVNLRAEGELREVEERRDTLVAERDDLVEAIKRLRQGISNLNREARERLLAAFETVNRHFQSLFAVLFGGGSAELQLVDAEDPLDAGLEIFARPPGKKPATMTLLSGGEQALTAIALIFAVFLTNPAPICVLDEVDAPLDDANVERYCDLLADMAARTETRFLVITHNPITMARMDRLYGVTMSERGVSQLVSVDLQVAEKILEAG